MPFDGQSGTSAGIGSWHDLLAHDHRAALPPILRRQGAVQPDHRGARGRLGYTHNEQHG